MGTGKTLIRDFEKETRTCLDGEEQIKREKREKEKERYGTRNEKQHTGSAC